MVKCCNLDGNKNRSSAILLNYLSKQQCYKPGEPVSVMRFIGSLVDLASRVFPRELLPSVRGRCPWRKLRVNVENPDIIPVTFDPPAKKSVLFIFR